MNYRKIDGSILKINEEALNQISKNLNETIIKQKEHCGVLLGREIINSFNVIIDKITEPSEKDIQSKYYFFRDNKYHQMQIKNEWEKSKGTCNYIGEWHTHLEEYPNPSSKDIKEWKKALKNFKFDRKTLFFIIIGTKEISIWEGYRKTLEFTKLSQV